MTPTTVCAEAAVAGTVATSNEALATEHLEHFGVLRLSVGRIGGHAPPCGSGAVFARTVSCAEPRAVPSFPPAGKRVRWLCDQGPH